MGISRDSRHKKRKTGGVRAIHQRKRKFELGRPPAMTKLGTSRVRPIRTRGGNTKLRALRLNTGSFSWGTEGISMKSRINNVVYHPTSNEYVRTNILTKNAIVFIDATPFKSWFYKRYGVVLGHDNQEELGEKVSEATIAKRVENAKNHELDPKIAEQFNSGRLLAVISSRPGQVGAANGYILEGEELAFYKKQMSKKRKH